MNLGTNVAKTREFDKAVFFTSVCDCMDGEDNQVLWLELDEGINGGYINLTLETTLANADYYWGRNWFQRMWWRVSNSFRLLVMGELKVSHTHYFNGREHIESYIEALQYGVNKLKQLEKV